MPSISATRRSPPCCSMPKYATGLPVDVQAVPDGAAMERVAQRIVAEGLSVRNVEEIVAVGGPDDAAATEKATRRMVEINRAYAELRAGFRAIVGEAANGRELNGLFRPG